MKRIWILFCLVIMGHSPGDCSAQSGESTWEVYLSANDVRCLAFDGDRIWAATGGGAVAFDPATGNYDVEHRRTGGLLSDSLTAVGIDPDGRIWFATERSGISIYDPEEATFTSYTSLFRPLPSDRIEALRIRGDSLFVGSDNGFTLLVSDEQRVACLEGIYLCGMPSYRVADLSSDPSGDGIWIATDKGVVQRTAAGEWIHYVDGSGQEGAGKLIRHRGEWAAAFGNDVLVLRTVGGQTSWVSLGQGLPGDAPVTDLLSDGGDLLASTTKGVWTFPGAGPAWSMVGSRAIPATCLLRTPDGTLWAGGHDSGEILDGLWKLTGSGWSRITFAGPSANSHYLALAFSPTGTLYATTAEKGVLPYLQTFDGVSWNPVQRMDDWTFDLVFNPDGDLWLAQCCCKETGCDLDLLQGGDLIREVPRNLRDLAYDDSGNLWAASDNAVDQEQNAQGIWFRDGGTGGWTQFNTASEPHMLTNRVRAVLPFKGDLWIGYSGKGVHRWDLGPDGKPNTPDDGLWTLYSTETAGRRIIDDSITRLAARENTLWIGTTAGLSLLDVRTETVKNISSGSARLPRPQVNAMLLLGDGGAWVATGQNGGLTRMRPNDVDFDYTHYGPPDIPHPNVETMAMDPDGRSIWLGTNRGLVRMTPPVEGGAETGELFAYPNPFVPGCGEGIRLLKFTGLADGVVAEVSGRIVARFDRQAPSTPVWDGRDSSGQPVAPGLYWIRLNTPQGIQSVGVGIGSGPCPR